VNYQKKGAHEMLARVSLRSGVPWGLVETVNLLPVSLGMIQDCSTRGSMGNDLKSSIVFVAVGAGAAACRRRFQTTAFYSTAST